MIEMHARRAMPDLASAEPQIHQPLAEGAILAAIGHVEIEPVRLDDCVSPGRRVMAVPRRARRRDRIEQGSQRRRPREPQRAMSGLPARCPQPLHVRHAPRADVIDGDALAHLCRKLQVAARQESAGRCVADVYRHEILARDAVAVGEDEILGVRRHDRAVEDLRLPEAAVLVPHVLNAQPRLPPHALDHLGGLRSRPVIGDDDVEVAVGLHGVSPQDLLQPPRLVVGREDDGQPHALTRRSDSPSSARPMRARVSPDRRMRSYATLLRATSSADL